MWLCLDCGSPVEEGSSACPACSPAPDRESDAASGPAPERFSGQVLPLACSCGKTLEIPQETKELPFECPWCGSEFTGGSPNAPAGQPRRGRLPLVLTFVGLVVFATYVVQWAVHGVVYAFGELAWSLEGGEEVIYQVPPGFSLDDQKKTLRAALRRLRQAGWPAAGRIQEEGRVALRVKRVNPEQLDRVLERSGVFRVYAVAPRQVQEEFNASREAPSGYRPVHCDVAMEGEYAYLRKGPILLRETPILDGRDVVEAKTEPPSQAGALGWNVSFALAEDGAKRLDGAAERLHRQEPHGVVALELDGQILALLVVRSRSFVGRAFACGDFTEEQARRIADAPAVSFACPLLRIEGAVPPSGEKGPSAPRVRD